MTNWNKPASKAKIEKTIEALKANGIDAVVVKDRHEAKRKVLSMIPEGSEVMTMTSVTLDELGIAKEINESEKYNSIRKKLGAMNREKHESEMNKLGAAPDYAVGSVHAVTEDGKIIVASATGSQLPAYVYGSKKVIWVVGTQKIVKNTDKGMKRLYGHTFPLENERAKIAYGVPGSFVSKILMINKEFTPGRISLVFVREAIGF